MHVPVLWWDDIHCAGLIPRRAPSGPGRTRHAMQMNISSLRTHGAAPMRRLQALTRIHGPGLVVTLLAVSIIYNLTLITWQVIPAHAPGAPPPRVTTPATHAAPGAGAPGARIVDLHLFGTASETKGPASAALDAPETQLNLVLRGILASDDGVESRAIITAGGGRDAEKIYKVGSKLPGGAVVHAIFSDRVILERGGHLEALRLPKDKDGQSIMRTPQRIRAPAGPGIAGTGAIRELRTTIARHPNRLADLVKALPATGRDGKQIGYRVFPGREGALFSKLGLQPGDIVTAVNGIPLSDPGKSLQVLRQLKDGGNVNLTIQRNGRSQTVALPGQ